MSDKIIFLDFDGVLNTEHYQNYLYHEGKPWQDEHGAFFDPEAVEQLRRIIDITHADIVVESSWKYLGLEAIQEMWEVRNMPGRVIDITPSTVSDSWLLNANLDELDPAMGHCKGMEIASWLSDHADRFVNRFFRSDSLKETIKEANNDYRYYEIDWFHYLGLLS